MSLYTPLLSAPHRPALINASYFFLAYISWYMCRAHINTGSAVLQAANFINNTEYTKAASIAFSVQFGSKFLSGAVIDFSNKPKLVFLTAGYICVLITIFNAFFMTAPCITATLIVVKGCAAFARISVLKILAIWYPSSIIGIVSSTLQIGSCIGDALARLTVGQLLGHYSAKTTWLILAAITLTCSLPALFLGRTSPPQSGRMSLLSRVAYKMRTIGKGRSDLDIRVEEAKLQQEAGGTPVPSYNTMAEEPTKRSLKAFYWEVMHPTFKVPRFWCIFVMTFLTTASRETVNTYTPQLYDKALGTLPHVGGSMSAFCPIPAALSIAICGYLFDALPKKRRCLIPVISYLIAWFFWVGFYFFLMRLPEPRADKLAPHPDQQKNNWIVLVFLLATTFFSAGPSSFLDGAYVVEIAGPKGAAFAAGLSSGMGYCGAAVAIRIFGRLNTNLQGWQTILGWTVFMAGTVVLLAACYSILEYRHMCRLERAAIKAEKAAALEIIVDDKTTGTL